MYVVVWGLELGQCEGKCEVCGIVNECGIVCEN
jgi:hypothetical protein